jgi:hypothetical protein
MAQGNVYSLNTVGYVNVTPAGNQFVCIANPVTNTTVANTLGNLIGTNLPVNGQVLKWNYAAVKFDIFQRVIFGNGWSPVAGATATLNVGEGVFMKSPTAMTNTFVGDVLQANLYAPGPLTNHLRSGLELIGNLVPDSGDINALGLGAAIPFSSSPQNQILKWNVGTQTYNIFSRVSFSPFWSPSVPTIGVGEGFFTKLAAATDWVRNYTVPQ